MLLRREPFVRGAGCEGSLAIDVLCTMRFIVFSGVKGSVRNGTTAVSFAHDKERSFVLCVDFSVGSDRQRRVRCAKREVEEEHLLQRAALRDGVQVSVLTIDVDDAVFVDHRRVDAPLEPYVWPLSPRT